MSFSAQLKSALSRHMPARNHCRLAELSAIVRLGGTIDWDESGSPIGFTVSGTNSAQVRSAFDLASALFDQRPSIKITRLRSLGRTHRYAAHLAGPAPVVQILNELGILDESLQEIHGIPSRLVREQCCGIGYVRGAFLAAGSVADPHSTYHLEVVSEGEAWARDFVKLLARLEVVAKISRRKHSWVVYLKEASQIASFLALIGSHTGVLDLEELLIRRQMRSDINRLVNCDAANAKKTAHASSQQLEDIALLEQEVGIDTLPAGLQAIAEARLANPDATIVELGELCLPPLSKSAAAHRLRRLGEVAQRLRGSSSAAAP